MVAIAKAIAWLLVHDSGRFRHSFVSRHLHRRGEALGSEIFLCQYSGKGRTLGRRSGMECRYGIGLVVKLGLGDAGCTKDGRESKECFHSPAILP